MIQIRRIVAVLLGVIFVGVLALALLVWELSNTLTDPEFLANQIEKEGVYRFVLSDLLDSALTDARDLEGGQFGLGTLENPLVASGLTNAEILGTVRKSVSPKNLQDLATPAIQESARYATSEKDSAVLEVDAERHLTRLLVEFNDLMLDSGGYQRFVESEVEPRVREFTRGIAVDSKNRPGWVRFAFGNDLDAGDEVARAVMATFTPEWLAQQVGNDLDELSEYLAGGSDGFEITVFLNNIDEGAASREIRANLSNIDDRELVYSGVIGPGLEGRIGDTIPLPYGITVTHGEVVDVLRQSAKAQLVDQYANKTIEAVIPYVMGQTLGFQLELDLLPIKDHADSNLGVLVRNKLNASVRRLSDCRTVGQQNDSNDRLRRLEQATCLPDGVSVDDMIEYANQTTGNRVQVGILQRIPDFIEFTEEDLRDALLQEEGQEGLEYLDEYRRWFQQGWSFDQEQLRDHLDKTGSGVQILDVAREVLGEGYVLSSRPNYENFTNPQANAALEEVRRWFKTVRLGGWITYAVSVLLLVAIGAVGGRSWQGRILWGSAVLVLSSSVLIVLSWPVYNLVSSQLFDQASNMVGPFGPPFGATSTLIAEKGFEVFRGIADEMAAGIRWSCLVLAVLSLAVLLVGGYCRRIVKTLKTKVIHRFLTADTDT